MKKKVRQSGKDDERMRDHVANSFNNRHQLVEPIRVEELEDFKVQHNEQLVTIRAGS